MRISKATVVTGTLLAVSILLALALRNGQQSEAAQDTAELVSVRVVEVGPEALAGELRVGGFLRAREDITISAERPGRVVALPVAEGSPVGAGDVIVRLDDTVAAANLAQARAAAREAGLSPELPAAELEGAKSALRRAEHEVALHNLTSPIAGIVEQHHVDIGEYVTPGMPLADVLDASKLILDVDVDAGLVGALGAGSATVDGNDASIVRVAARADPGTRLFRVELEIDPGTRRPGMHAVARFRLPPGPLSFHVPKATVRTRHGERGVFVVRSGRAVWVALQLAEIAHRPDLWRVTDGALKPGDALVVAGFSGLRADVAVQVRK